MTDISDLPGSTAPTRATDEPLARRTTIARDLVTIGRRACRSVFREPEFFIPALFVPVFFYIIQTMAEKVKPLKKAADAAPPQPSGDTGAPNPA